ncbi:MAG: LysM peptidoglycan-binding domain-containing protein, partial [Pseudomonadales bacterium]|nr:LysM peptidoglycan-binding domain-containing protein [Pseudomonadales bacterium]
MIQRLLVLSALLVLFQSQSAFGVGLGELDLHSALNQRFEAEIALTNVGGLGTDEVLPNLASQEDFDRVGVERVYALTDLRFKVVKDEDGDMVIKVTSNRPIVEPFLNFLVEVLWPSGRILREYTVLLDPPTFSEDAGIQPLQTAEVIRSEPATAPPSQSSVRRPVPPAPTRQESSRQQESQSRGMEGMTDGDEYGVTGPGDTLWKIALKVRPNQSISVQQTMLALQQANPDAFINNNINLLKAGHVLRIPGEREIRATSFASAVEEVKIQNEEFDAIRSGSVAQLDASRRKSSRASSSAADDDGELKLLAADSADDGRRAGQGGDAGRSQQLENSLAVAREDLDRARRANSDLNVKLEDLQGQLETLNEIVKLKDDQLAALRAEVQRMQSAAPTASAPVNSVSTPAASGGLLSNPLVLGGLGLLLALAIAGLLFLRNRKKSE